jgi:hypothetical protein
MLMFRKLLTVGAAALLLTACPQPQEDPAFDNDFRFEDPPPATPMPPAQRDPAMDPMMHPDSPAVMHPDSPHVQQPGMQPGTPGTQPQQPGY